MAFEIVDWAGMEKEMASTNKAVHTNVKFKDRLFRIIFGAEENKKHLISLYDALNGTDYGENEEVEIMR